MTQRKSSKVPENTRDGEPGLESRLNKKTILILETEDGHVAWLILEHRLALWFFGGAKKWACNGLNRSHWEHQSNHSISDKRAWDARKAVVFC